MNTALCSWVRTSLGVYVLGAIDPAERAEVDAHLPSCSRCRDEVAALAGLPALLGRINEEQITQVAERPPELLDSLLAAASAERPNTRRHWLSLGVAAAVVLIVGALLGGLLQPGSHEAAAPLPTTSSSAAPATPRSSRPAGEVRKASNRARHITAWVGIDAQEWGTALTLRLTGVPPGSRCHLYAIAKDGRRDIAGSWAYGAANDSEWEEFHGSTMISRGDLSRVEIVTTGGQRLLTIPV
jgi:anti-sigma factor RsiW